MKIIKYIMLCLFTLMLSDVYASTKIADRDEIVDGAIPKPAHIWVYDFFTSASDIPAESALAGQHSDNDPPQTASQISAGRKLGAEIGTELIKQFKAMGLQADRATGETEMQVNDVVIQGYLVSEVAGNKKNGLCLDSALVSPSSKPWSRVSRTQPRACKHLAPRRQIQLRVCQAKHPGWQSVF